jgi:flagellar hook assembly protein FlgD
MTVDQSSQVLNAYTSYDDHLQFSAYDPFNNQPLIFTFNFAQPGAVFLAFTPSATGPDNCNPPGFCLLNGTVLESGPHTIAWAGTDGTGAFRPDIKSSAIIINQATFPVNGVVVYGRKPVVATIRVTPPNFGPANGTQAVTFTLATYQSQTAAVTVSFLNQSSLSTLRTISIPAQAPGNVSVTWDGRANDGSLVAPGAYTVTVVAVDSLGNTGSGQILTRVEY